MPPEFDASQFDIALAPVLSQLEGLLDAAELVHNASLAPGSPALAEHDRQATWAGKWGDTPIDNALTMVRLLVVAAEGHMRSILQLHGAPRPGPTSFDVLARAALEALAQAVWLVEPGIGPEVRVRRYENEMLYSLREQKKLGITGANFQPQIDAILDTAEAVGIGTLRAKKNNPRRLLDRPTTTTQVGRLMLDHGQDNLGVTAYRVLCASTHGTAYGLLRYVTSVGEHDAPDHQIGAIGLSSTEAITLIRILVIAYRNALDRLKSYLGWHSPDYDKMVNNVGKFLAGYGAR